MPRVCWEEQLCVSCEFATINSRCTDFLRSTARGERHGPSWYLTVTLAPGRTTGAVVPGEQLEQVRLWVENYQRTKQDLESISAINRELLRRKRPGSPKSSKKG